MAALTSGAPVSCSKASSRRDANSPASFGFQEGHKRGKRVIGGNTGSRDRVRRGRAFGGKCERVGSGSRKWTGIAVGLFLIGPGRHYPEHHHEAEEIYFPLSGDTLWRQGNEEPKPHAIGDAIHNPPWLKHEMWTRETPLFALYCWRGPVANQAQLTEP